jgi:hypothetical protein
MVHTVRIDDTTVAGKRFMKEFSRVRKGIEFENPALTGVVPEGYMTLEEFRISAKEDIRKYYRENGLH